MGGSIAALEHEPSSICSIYLASMYRAHHSGPSPHTVLLATANIASTIITAIGAAHLLRRRRPRGQLSFNRYKEGLLLSQKRNHHSAEEFPEPNHSNIRVPTFALNDFGWLID